MKVNWINEKKTLERLIGEGVSYERIGRQYDVTGAAVKKAAKKLGIELEQKREINPNEHFNKGKRAIIHHCLNCEKELIKSQTKFCSNECQVEYNFKQKIKKWKECPNTFNSEHSYPFIKRYFFEKCNNKCEKCGWGEVNEFTNTIPLELHHIDGDCTNNKENNLQLLCPNCHSLTETFGSKNKDSKRYKLKEYKHNMSKKRLVKLLKNTKELDRKEILELLK